MYAEVIVDISLEKLDRTFTYRVPEALRGQVRPGTMVTIPFGNGKSRRGYVIALSEHADYPDEKIKPLLEIVRGQVPIEGQMISIAAWMREEYGSTMNQALKAVLPVKRQVRQRRQTKDSLLAEERPFFSLKLCYRGDTLVEAVLDGKKL